MLRIVHMASLARSGETLMLRTLAAHPQVHVVHDLHPGNDRHETRLFELLRVWPLAALPRREAGPAVPASARVLLVKQGVFSMAAPFHGFGLVRNPYSVFSSLWSYDARLAGRTPDEAGNRAAWRAHRLPRLVAWTDAMEPALLPRLLAERDPVRQFLLFWQARTAQIVAHCRTVICYEAFVALPREHLLNVCEAADLPFDPALLKAHERFRPGQRGHGGIDLGAPIRPAPPWQPDPLVPVASFVQAVDEGPIPAYRGLYGAQGRRVQVA